MGTKLVEIEIDYVKHDTDNAMLIVVEDKEYWIPKSKIEDQSQDDNDVITGIFIPEWLAIEKGLV